MSKPFIGAVLDLVGPKDASVLCGCQVLSQALDSALGVEAPGGCFAHVSAYFESILTAYYRSRLSRDKVEHALYNVFELAAEQKFQKLCSLPLRNYV